MKTVQITVQAFVEVPDTFSVEDGLLYDNAGVLVHTDISLDSDTQDSVSSEKTELFLDIMRDATYVLFEAIEV